MRFYNYLIDKEADIDLCGYMDLTNKSWKCTGNFRKCMGVYSSKSKV